MHTRNPSLLKQKSTFCTLITSSSHTLLDPHTTSPMVDDHHTTTTSPPPTTTIVGDVMDHPEPMHSFKQESNQFQYLSPQHTHSLNTFKTLIQQAITNQDLTFLQKQNQPISQLSIYGIPIFQDNRTDVVLLKFLKATNFKVKQSFIMFKNTLQWRQTFSTESLLNEKLCNDHDLEKALFNHGYDNEGRPVCYNVYGEFKNKELYEKMFSNGERRLRFLRSMIQFLERSIRKLDFGCHGVSTLLYISDFKNAPGPMKRDLWLTARQALQIMHDYYPEFVEKHVFINAPWWYSAFHPMISPFMFQRTKSKYVFASTVRTPETLFIYVKPEHVPIQYGGLNAVHCDRNPVFTTDDPASVVTLKPATEQSLEIIVNEKCLFVLEFRVVGWKVSYNIRYVRNNINRIIKQVLYIGPTDERVIRHSVKISELGKMVLTIENLTSKKKALLYRFKASPLSE